MSDYFKNAAKVEGPAPAAPSTVQITHADGSVGDYPKTPNFFDTVKEGTMLKPYEKRMLVNARSGIGPTDASK